MSFVLNQNITYWTSAGTNENSEPTFSTPVTIAAQYAVKDGITTNEQGDSVKIMWAIYTKAEIPKRALVVLGASVLTTPPVNSRMMVDNKSNPYFTNLFKSVL